MPTQAISRTRFSKRRKRKRKYWLFLASAVVLLAIVIGLGFRYYPQFKQKRLLINARQYFDKKEYTLAVLTTRRAIQVNPGSIEATRLMADFADMAKSSEAIYWRRRVTQLEPKVLDNYLAFARAAFKFDKIEDAKEAIGAVPDSVKKNAAYHELAAEVALATNKLPEAESHFAQAAAMEPQNQNFQLSLDALHIRSADAAIQTQARADLEKLLTNPVLRETALRVLIQDSINTRDWDKAVARGKELGASADGSFENRMIYLNLLNRLKHRDFTSFLSHLQEEAAGDPQKLSALIRWMNNNGFALLAIDWCKHLPSDIVSAMPVPISLAQSYVVIGDWSGLSPLVSAQPDIPAKDTNKTASQEKTEPDWTAYNFEFMRLALRARLLRDQGDINESRIQWNAAVKEASGRPQSLAALERLAVNFKWDNEATDILWMIARSTNEPMSALKVLYANYAAQQSTRDMLRVVARMFELDPTDAWAKNNLASLSMLLEENPDQAIKFAQELHLKEPDNPTYTSTYAFALHFQGRSAEAVEMMKSIGPDRLQQPAYAAYYGVILAAAGAQDESKKFFALAKNAPLLPEEKKLVEEAQKNALAKPAVKADQPGNRTDLQH